MSQNQNEENTLEIPRLKSVNNIFDSVAFSLVQEGSYLRIIYTFVNSDCSEDCLVDGLTVSSGILCTSYLEAAYHINKLVSVGIFSQIPLGRGALYNSLYEFVERIDWNKLARQLLEEIDPEQEQITLH